MARDDGRRRLQEYDLSMREMFIILSDSAYDLNLILIFLLNLLGAYYGESSQHRTWQFELATSYLEV